eukprot:897511-Amphidinium_carterae.2
MEVAIFSGLDFMSKQTVGKTHSRERQTLKTTLKITIADFVEINFLGPPEPPPKKWNTKGIGETNRSSV